MRASALAPMLPSWKSSSELSAGTPESDVALAQAVRLATPDSTVTLVHAFTLASVNEVELALGTTWEHEESIAQEMLDEAMAWAIEVGELDPAQISTRVVPGPKARRVLETVTDSSATLLVAGSHGRSRLGGAIRGSVASYALHSAPCSVLIARSRDSTSGESELGAMTRSFPTNVVCGIDGSPASVHAVQTARDVHSRFGCQTRFVAAEDGSDVAFREAARQAPAPAELEMVPGEPVEVLLASAVDAELLVVGSRGRTGTRAIGSVSEQVAHAATCSVLIAR
jgi:nucleotide-binding universal stress UspA family protein